MNILFTIVTMVTNVTNSTTVFMLYVHLGRKDYQFSYVDYGYICFHGNIVYHRYQCFFRLLLLRTCTTFLTLGRRFISRLISGILLSVFNTEYLSVRNITRRMTKATWILIKAIVKIYIWHSEDHASWYIVIMKANEMHYFSDLFAKVLHMFRTCPLSIIRSISTLYTRNR